MLSGACKAANKNSFRCGEKKKSCEDKKSCIFYDYDTDLCQ